MLKVFRVFNFRTLALTSTKIFNNENFPIYRVFRKQKTTIHDPDVQLHYRQDPLDKLARLRHRWFPPCSAGKGR